MASVSGTSSIMMMGTTSSAAPPAASAGLFAAVAALVEAGVLVEVEIVALVTAATLPGVDTAGVAYGASAEVAGAAEFVAGAALVAATVFPVAGTPVAGALFVATSLGLAPVAAGVSWGATGGGASAGVGLLSCARVTMP